MCVYERKRERKKPSKLLMTPVHTETARGIECETEAETVFEFHVRVAVSLTLLIWEGKICMLRRKSDMKPL